MFLITGDNWACGSWGRSDPNSSIKLMSRGLSECMDSEEFNVPNVNLACRNQGNFDTLTQLQNWLEQNPKWNIKYILFFLADFSRDIQAQGSYTDSVDQYCREFHKRVTALTEKTNLPFWLIGGTGDVPHQLCQTVPVACQSFTNFLLNNQPEIDQPVVSTFENMPKSHVMSWKQHNDKDLMLQSQQAGQARQQQWQQDQIYFFPDKQNPNLSAHVKLFWLIKEKLKFLG